MSNLSAWFKYFFWNWTRRKLADINIFRYEQDDKQTLGYIVTKNPKTKKWFPPLILHSLELPWRGNQEDISRILPGEYEAKFYFSPKFKYWVIFFLNVPGRTDIEIHIGNYYRDIQGCIIAGLEKFDINNDGKLDMVKSRVAFNMLMEQWRDKNQSPREKWRPADRNVKIKVSVYDCF